MNGSKIYGVHVQFQDPTTKFFSYTKDTPVGPMPTVIADTPTQARDRYLLDPANKDVADAVLAGTARVGFAEVPAPAFPV